LPEEEEGEEGAKEIESKKITENNLTLHTDEEGGGRGEGEVREEGNPGEEDEQTGTEN